MKTGICYILAAVLGCLGLLVAPECVREFRHLSRLDREGLRIAAEITRIEEESVATLDDSVERATYGPYKTVENATVRYFVAGQEYQGRHRLPEAIRRHRLGDTLPILVLADEPERSHAADAVIGSSIMMFTLPGALLFAAAVFGFVGSLLRETKRGRRP